MSDVKHTPGWEFRFEAPKGERIMNRFWGVTNDEGFWFSHETRDWSKDHARACSNWDHAPRTFKAFKRYLRRHPELQSCSEVRLGSLFVGYDIYAKASGEQP